MSSDDDSSAEAIRFATLLVADLIEIEVMWT